MKKISRKKGWYLITLLTITVLLSTGIIAVACHPHHHQPDVIYVAKPTSSNCGPDHFPLIVDNDWSTYEWLSIGDVLYFNYTVFHNAKSVSWHYGYWEAEGAGHINESIQLPIKIVKQSNMVHLRTEYVRGNCWWGGEWNLSVWNHKTHSWVLVMHTTGGQDGSYYDTGLEWFFKYH